MRVKKNDKCEVWRQCSSGYFTLSPPFKEIWPAANLAPCLANEGKRLLDIGTAAHQPTIVQYILILGFHNWTIRFDFNWTRKKFSRIRSIWNTLMTDIRDRERRPLTLLTLLILSAILPLLSMLTMSVCQSVPEYLYLHFGAIWINMRLDLIEAISKTLHLKKDRRSVFSV